MSSAHEFLLKVHGSSSVQPFSPVCPLTVSSLQLFSLQCVVQPLPLASVLLSFLFVVQTLPLLCCSPYCVLYSHCPYCVLFTAVLLTMCCTPIAPFVLFSLLWVALPLPLLCCSLYCELHSHCPSLQLFPLMLFSSSCIHINATHKHNNTYQRLQMR